MTVRVVFANDVQELRDIVERELGVLDACASHLDPAGAASWSNTVTITTTWVAAVNVALANPGGIATQVLPADWGTLYGQGRGLEAILRQNWWPRMTAAGCAPAFPQPGPPREPGFSSDTPGNPLSILTSLEGIAKAILIALVWREVRDWTR